MARKIPKKWEQFHHGSASAYDVEAPDGTHITIGGGPNPEKVANQVSRLPRLLMLERVVKGMFDDGVLDPYPTSDDSDEYTLRELTRWKSKAERKQGKKKRTP